ncbi:MAG: hypothetical protein O3A84_10920 [Proteobacteria bacterium]|nr:hypothetical protein [Pseudomonadota bacterium]
MKILYLQDLYPESDWTKVTCLSHQGHCVENPILDSDDFDTATQTAQVAFDNFQPDVVVGRSRGGAVAMNINTGNSKVILLCPAWKKWGSVTSVKTGTIILHSIFDDQVPFSDSVELEKKDEAFLIEVGFDHQLHDPMSLKAVMKMCEWKPLQYKSDIFTQSLILIDQLIFLAEFNPQMPQEKLDRFLSIDDRLYSLSFNLSLAVNLPGLNSRATCFGFTNLPGDWKNASPLANKPLKSSYRPLLEPLPDLEQEIQLVFVRAFAKWELAMKSFRKMVENHSRNLNPPNAEFRFIPDGTGGGQVDGKTDKKQTSDPASGQSEGDVLESPPALKPSHRKAYVAFVYVMARLEKGPSELTDAEAHCYIENNGIDLDEKVIKTISKTIPGFQSIDLDSYQVPPIDSWKSYLSVARSKLGTNKTQPRANRPHGKSIVRESEI